MRKYFCVILLTFLGAFNLISGQSALTLNKPVYSRQTLDSLAKVLPNMKDDLKIKTIIKLAYGFINIDTIKSDFYIQLGQKLVKEKNLLNDEAQLLLEKGKLFNIQEEFPESIDCFFRALKLFEETNNIKGVATAYNFIGQGYYNENKFLKAVKYYLISFEKFKEIDDNEGAAVSSNDLGIVNYFLGNYDISLKYYLKSLSIKEKTKYKASIAISYNNVALVYFALKDFDNALKYLFKANELNQSTKNMPFDATIFSNIANAYIENKNGQAGYEFSIKAIDASRKYNNNPILAYSYLNLGKLFLYNEEYISAKNYITFALNLYDSLKMPQGYSESLNRLAKIDMIKQDYNSAIQKLTNSLQIVKKYGFRERIKECYIQLSICYKELNDYSSSYEYLNQYVLISDSLMNSDKNRQLMALQIAYETENKSREIDLLKKNQNKDQIIKIFLAVIMIFAIFLVVVLYGRYKTKNLANKKLEEKNIEINKQKEDLQKLNFTKDKLFTIIAHDLKSPFQGLLGFSSLIVESFEKISKTELMSHLLLLNKQIKNLFNLIENLLEWARLQTNGFILSFEKVNLKELIDSVVKIAENNAEKKEITISYSISDDINVHIDKNMIFSAIQNILSNSIKFTNRGGQISINAIKEKDFIEISIADNGIGISPQDLEELFGIKSLSSRNGTENEKGTGLGLLITKEFIEKSEGKISVESEENKGTKTTIFLKNFEE